VRTDHTILIGSPPHRQFGQTSSRSQLQVKSAGVADDAHWALDRAQEAQKAMTAYSSPATPTGTRQSFLGPETPTPNDGEPCKPAPEQPDRSRLGHCGQFGNDHLAVTYLKISDQDLVWSGVEGAATPAFSAPKRDEGAPSAPATIATPATSTGCTTPAATEATITAGGMSDTAHKTRKPTAATTAKDRAALAAAEKTTAAAAITGLNTGGTTVAAVAAGAAGAAAWAAPVRTGKATLARQRPHVDEKTAATAAASDNQRHIARGDHKAATTTAAATTDSCGHSGTADGDLQDLAFSQNEVTADLGTSTAYAACNIGKAAPAPALCAKSEDLISVGSRHHEHDETSSIGEVERHGTSGRMRRGYRQKCRPSKQKLFHFLPFSVVTRGAQGCSVLA
jgi:hypothetical protein